MSGYVPGKNADLANMLPGARAAMIEIRNRANAPVWEEVSENTSSALDKQEHGDDEVLYTSPTSFRPTYEQILDERKIANSVKIIRDRIADPLKVWEVEGEGTSSALDKQIGGSHYKDFAIQPIEFIHKNGIGFVAGNVIKYVCRYRAKNGLQDLEKAKHYIEILIEQERSKGA